MALLRHSAPGKEVRFVPLDREVTTVGRSQECDIVLDDLMASRKHCEVRKLHGGHLLVDLKSKNGTHVNGMAISTWKLSDGDLISIGGQRLLYKLQK